MSTIVYDSISDAVSKLNLNIVKYDDIELISKTAAECSKYTIDLYDVNAAPESFIWYNLGVIGRAERVLDEYYQDTMDTFEIVSNPNSFIIHITAIVIDQVVKRAINSLDGRGVSEEEFLDEVEMYADEF